MKLAFKILCQPVKAARITLDSPSARYQNIYHLWTIKRYIATTEVKCDEDLKKPGDFIFLHKIEHIENIKVITPSGRVKRYKVLKIKSPITKLARYGERSKPP